MNLLSKGQPARGTGVRILTGDSLTVLRTLPAQSVQMCVTSPPYFGLRDYGVAGQIGLEPTPEEFVSRLVTLFREVRRVLKDDGTLWLNLGDSYAGSWGNQGRKETRGTQRPINGGMMQSFSGYPSRQPFRAGNPAKNNGVSNRDGLATPPGLKPKDLIGIPWRVAFALQADGWYLRSDIIWHKPNPMPESVKDRPTKAHEYLFLLAKGERYLYDAEAILEPFQTSAKENYPARARITGRGDQGAAAARGNDRGKSGGFPPRQWIGRDRGNCKGNADRGDGGAICVTGNPNGRNRRSVWTVTTRPFKGAHFATFPPALIEPCILAGSRPGDVVLDPFNGAGTTGMVSRQHGRKYLGIELNPEYVKLTLDRLDSSPAWSPGLNKRSTGLSKKAA